MIDAEIRELGIIADWILLFELSALVFSSLIEGLLLDPISFDAND